MIYILQQKNKALSLLHNDYHYVVGFKNLMHARKVHYNIHPEPNLKIINLDEKKESAYISGNLCLSIPKCIGSIHEPMNDGNFHMKLYSNSDVITWPFCKNLGVLLPYVLEDETSDEFIFRTIMMDPLRDQQEYIPKEYYDI